MSWKAEVTTAGDNGKWSTNGLRFATRTEAQEYALDLSLAVDIRQGNARHAKHRSGEPQLPQWRT